MRIRLSLLLLACAFATTAAAQGPVLRPGSAALAPDAIAERTEMYDLYAIEGVPPLRMGEMTLRTRLGQVNGRDAIIRVEMTEVDGELIQVDSFALDRRTLAPIVLRISRVQTGRALDFGDGTVRQVDDGDWGADTTDVPVDEPLFIPESIDLLLNAMPLAAGYAARVAVFDADEGAPLMMEVDVEEADEVRIPGGGRVAAWRVRVDDGTGPATYWMDRESHTLVQWESTDGVMRLVRSRGTRSRARDAR